LDDFEDFCFGDCDKCNVRKQISMKGFGATVYPDIDNGGGAP
jgi:hypothetical protein